MQIPNFLFLLYLTLFYNHILLSVRFCIRSIVHVVDNALSSVFFVTFDNALWYVFPPASSLLFSQKYLKTCTAFKIYQETGTNRPKEQSTILSIVVHVKIVKLTGLTFVFVILSRQVEYRRKIAEKTLKKDIGILKT